MIITIDGPSGAGKSTTAIALARRLGFEYLDTGAMYRAITVAALRAKIMLDDESALSRLLSAIQLRMPSGSVYLNDEEVSDQIRTSQVTSSSGKIASSPTVRRFLVGLQRSIADGRNMVCEGRDQGTIVFPEAICKFYLTADPVERARRRQRELVGRGEVVTWQDVLRAQDDRDRRDASRDLAPMVPAGDAITLDSTHFNLDQIVQRMEQEFRHKQAARGK